MKNLLLWFIYLFKSKNTSHTSYLDKDKTLRLSHTIIPQSYVNHTIEEDKKDYSLKITTIAEVQ